MTGMLAALDGFLQGHRRCGDLDGIWSDCPARP